MATAAAGGSAAVPAGGGAAARTVGLTLGKYAPFHEGHASLVRTALAENDAAIAVIYDSPEVTDIPLNVRAQWIRDVFAADGPRLLVVEAWDGPSDSGDTEIVKLIQEEYLVGLLETHGYGPGMAAWRVLRNRPAEASPRDEDTSAEIVDGAAAAAAATAPPPLTPITAFYSSEFYGEHVSEAFGCVDRRIDPTRCVLPISGTACRTDPHACRALMPPRVYRDHVVSVVFVGAPSTGKSTITEEMAKAMGTCFMPEYGREYWEKHAVDRRLTPEQLVEIAEVHRAREDALALEARGYLFVDTNAMTTCMFGLAYHGHALPRLAELAAAAEKRYDLVFLCGDEIPYADTWDRSGDADRKKFQKQTRGDLVARRVPFIPLVGPLQERVATVHRVLARFNKWRGLGDMALDAAPAAAAATSTAAGTPATADAS